MNLIIQRFDSIMGPNPRSPAHETLLRKCAVNVYLFSLGLGTKRGGRIDRARASHVRGHEFVFQLNETNDL